VLNRVREALTVTRLLGATVLLGVGLAAASFLSGGNDPWAQSPWADSTPVENAPLVVVLCHGANQAWPANLDASYFEAQFTETTGSSTVADYWRDISHGRFSIEGSLVIDVQLDVPRDEVGDRADDDWKKCRDGLDEQYDIDWDRYLGAVVFKPQTLGRTIDAIDEDDTEIRVRTERHSVAEDWPTPPFTAVVTTSGSLWPNPKTNTVFENVQVTAVSVDGDNTVTFTVERGHTGGYKDRASTPTAFAENTRIRDVSDIRGQSGEFVVSAHMAPSVINHELGHFFGWKHSRKLSTAASDYGDCFDIMSAMSCTRVFDMSVEYAGRDAELAHGLGMTSIYLDRKDWIDVDDRETFSCGMATYQLRALGLDGSGLHQIRVPVTASIGGKTETDYLTVELRSQRFAWDRGVPSDAVVLHLRGDDGYAYLIDDADAGGTSGMVAGDRYEISGWILMVGDIDAGEGTAEVTVTAPQFMADCPLGGGTSTPSTTSEPPTTTVPPTTTTVPPSTTTEPPITTTEPDRLEGAACVPGSWVLDSQEFVDALARASGATGGEMQYGGGPYTITIGEDGAYAALRDGWAFRFESPEGNMEVVFDSDESGILTWDDAGNMTFVEADTTSLTDVTVIFEVDGQIQTFPMSALPAPILAQVPEPELMSGSGIYTCEGDWLQLVSDDSGIPANWARTG